MTSIITRVVRPLSALVAIFTLSGTVSAQNSAQSANWDPQQVLHTETYVHPPAVIERIIMAPRTDISFTNPSPDRKWFVRMAGPDRGDVAEFGKEHLNLGGLQIEHKANRARTLTTSTHRTLSLVDPQTNTTRTVETPKGASISSPVWSPNGTQIAYIANLDDASYLYVADAASGKSTRVSTTPLLATLVTAPEWTGDGSSLVAVVVPEGRGPAPVFGNNGIANGPEVRLTESRTLPEVIDPSLLENRFEKAELKYYTTGQLVVIDVKSKRAKKVGAPAMIRAVDASPDGQYIRVTKMTEPFSYIVPVSSFGSVNELWDMSGAVVATLAKTPLREGDRGADGDTPAPAGRGGQSSPSDTGKRNIQWNPVGPGLVYMESQFASDNASRPNAGGAAPAGGGRGGRGGGRGQPAARPGAAARPAPTSIRYMSWVAPYGPNDTKVIYEGSGQLANVSYSVDGKTMFVSDSGSVSAVRVIDPSKHYPLGRGISLAAGGGGFGGGGGRGGGAANDSAGTNGTLAMRVGSHGVPVVVMASDAKSVFVNGTRAPGARWETQAPRPWVDRLDIETAQRTRVFESPTDGFDEVVAPLDDDYSKIIYDHESATTIQDAWLRDLKSGKNVQLTHNTDVAPEVTGAQHKRLVITRPRDGLKFYTDVTLPRDWTPGTKLPGIIWFYPREFTSQADYDRSRYSTNINKFPDLVPARPASSVKLWVTQGYALIEPDIPIFGDSGKMNDHYTRDLKENLDAVLDAVVDAGYVDRNKMGIGGHSYGAFSTVNALTLTPYFKAGIAGDGMYNRSLTPFGFQSERRDFFTAQETYLDMSPFYRADKIVGALLMYHAMEDQNVGTAPISSIRMFHALQGLGKPAALYMYPYEDHSDATYQTDLDIWSRWLAWFDVYVKNPKSEQKPMVP